MKLDIKFHPGQSKVYNSPARFKIVPAGRRWGKTFYAMRSQLLHALEEATHPDAETWYIAPTFNTAKSIYWGPLKRLCGVGEEDSLAAKVWETEGKIELINGRTIHLKGADDPDRLRGNALSYVIFDEYAYMKPETWDVVVQPALADTQGKALFIGTPDKKNHMYDLVLEAENDPDWEVFSFRTVDNPFIPPSEITRAKKNMSRDAFRQEFEASFYTGSGAIFKDLDKIQTVSEPPNIGNVYIAVDPSGYGDVSKLKGSRLKRLDETAIAVVEVSHEGWTVHDIVHGRWDVRETALQILLAARKYRPIGIGVEQGSLFNAMRPYLDEQQSRLGVYLPIIPIKNLGAAANKNSRITWALQGRLEKGRLSFVEGDYVKTVLEQFADFPNGRHDDLIDALSMVTYISEIHFGDDDSIVDTWTPEDEAVGY